MSSRGWMFTIFDTTWKFKMDERIAYCIYQLEEAPETKKLHFQGYVLLKSPRTLALMKTILNCEQAHLEKRMGNHKQAKEYCEKEESRVDGPWEFGKEPNQGSRSDLNKVKAKLDEGKSLGEVAEEHFVDFVKYHKAFEKYQTLKIKPRETKPYVIWIYGPSGCGKSKQAFEFAKSKSTYYYKPAFNKWWDGYTGQECVVIDDYKGGWEIEYLLNLLDWYPMRVEVKGGSINFNSKWVIITSNKRPAQYCTDEPKQLIRRIDSLQDLTPSTDEHRSSEGNTRTSELEYDSDDNIINYRDE